MSGAESTLAAVVPALGPEVPSRNGGALRLLGRAVLAALGWRIEGEVPNVPRCVIIVAPHTSNWDFVIGFAAMLAIDFRVTWLGKHQIFRGPLGVAEQAAAALAPPRSTFLAVSPEGTRRKVERWKSGFWRIARAAGAPILPVAFDYRSRAVILRELFAPTADYAADLAALQRLFSAEMARHPRNY